MENKTTKMIKILRFSLILFLVGCNSTSGITHKERQEIPKKDYDFTNVFGSCNDQDNPQPLWEPILDNEPDAFIWGGDNIYADTPDMEKMKAMYDFQENVEAYQKLVNTAVMLGTWDDHDFGKNNAGKEWEKKAESQQLFLDFMNVPQGDIRRAREGVYYAQDLIADGNTIKVILLDTRYFRDPINESRGGSILGDAQWKWLEKELNNSTADYHIIMSSIQVLSMQHRFEKWANFPEEREHLLDLIASSGIKNPIIISGDRHISEFSKMDIEGLKAPLYDFTSSGMTHVYESFSGEANMYREGEVIFQLSFGVLNFDFENEEVNMQMRGIENALLQETSVKF